MTDNPSPAPEALAALAAGEHADPFGLLGPHREGAGWVIRALIPGAEAVEAVLADGAVALEPEGPEGLFAGPAGADRPGAYRLRARAGSASWELDDAYRFGPVLGDLDEHLLAEGTHLHLWQALGAHPCEHEGARGVRFAVWAPNARRVSVVGDFNQWNGRAHVMRARGASGIWEIFLPGLDEGTRYKYEIKAADGALLPLKADPVGFGSEHPPATASVVRDLSGRDWRDGDWMARRAEAHRIDAPISIYEVHLGSWRRAEEGRRPLSYWELAAELVPYVRDMGFTHIELMPVSEYPFDGSWGYQPVGLYAPTIRHGTPSEFRDLVEAAHDAGLGVILDWVPGHFPTDAHGLGRFDGTPLYEHADPREGFHRDWNTLIFNYGRREVGNYLIANALYWLREHHLDGLRVDAVASMLYRDYSREAGQWVPNIHGGRENLEAISFLKRMNEAAYAADPSIMTVAEESTAWPGVSRPTSHGGLGFGFKWNMGWMNDTLDYVRREPIHRRHHHHQMTFGLHYAFTENFVLPLSHDEVVHGKGSILGRMPGNDFDRFANLRAYYGFMWGHPGKKLLFMGQEFAQPDEWNHLESLPWHLLDDPRHAGTQALVRDLNHLYRETPALHRSDSRADGFAWVEASAEDISVYAWERRAEGAAPVLVVCNFTPVERSAFRIGVPEPGRWRERINSDATVYGGAGRGNLGGVDADPLPSHGRAQSIEITLPPLATLFFELET
ncbi:1,4-alpha-glucan branching protein GlgB [Paralimibaculum aggregatum]|uniref:1,4-alpha-glucan branching enzyme GlgB n=1 Tax=Paralimibaculum aggregatum TaxID=3036245 RepID=A0ABQ6LU61_9RHOB|nr:1,4-alpha-glucan branching protein GlgB [Limibaculum sp. NKW23]GMG85618.1 1,4-alpha-glucan branching protein GlgB [Limibaculum sp. NKW23]